MPQKFRKFDFAASLIILVAFAFHTWYAANFDLVQDEAYYWQWSRHLAFGYYDNTPLMAWVIHLFTSTGTATELTVRFGALILSAWATQQIYRFAKELFGPAVGLVAVVITCANPLFGAGSFLMTQDPVQLYFWISCAWCTWRAIQSNSGPKSWAYWLGAGFLAGLTAMSKLNGLLILPSVFLFLLMDPEARVWIKRPQPYVAALVALAIFAPFVWWNHSHENAFWIHIHSMGTRTDNHGSRFTLKYLGDFLGAQAGLFSPLLFITYLWALIKTPRLPNLDRGALYCWSLSVVVFIVTIFVSLRSRVEGNWAVACYLTGIILIAYYMVKSWPVLRMRIWHGVSVALAAIVTILLFGTTLWPNSPRIAALDKKTNELYGWDTLAVRVENERQAIGTNPFVFGVNYRMPSEMAFYLPGQPQTYSLFLHDRANEYMFWEDPKALIGHDAVFVNDTPNPDHLDDVRAVFDRVDVEQPEKIYRPTLKSPIRIIQVFRCYGFKGYDRQRWQRGW